MENEAKRKKVAFERIDFRGYNTREKVSMALSPEHGWSKQRPVKAFPIWCAPSITFVVIGVGFKPQLPGYIGYGDEVHIGSVPVGCIIGIMIPDDIFHCLKLLSHIMTETTKE
jgi:hypothetical protein